MEQRIDNIYTFLAALPTPFFIAVTVTFALWLLRDEIRNAIRRMASLSVGGFNASLSEQQRDAPPATPLPTATVTDVPSAVIGEADGVQAAQVGFATGEVAAHLGGSLPTVAGGNEKLPILPGLFNTKVVLDNMMPNPPPEDLSTLDRTTGLSIFWYVAWTFEKIYRLIWGTQILLIVRANAAPVSRLDAMALYQSSVSSGNKQTFDQWVGFPISQALLSATNDNYTITPGGRLFLEYLVKEGYPPEKTF